MCVCFLSLVFKWFFDLGLDHFAFWSFGFGGRSGSCFLCYGCCVVGILVRFRGFCLSILVFLVFLGLWKRKRVPRNC